MSTERRQQRIANEMKLMDNLSDQVERTYEDTYQQLHSTFPPQTITFGTSTADVLSVGRGFMGGFDLTMQTPENLR